MRAFFVVAILTLAGAAAAQRIDVYDWGSQPTAAVTDKAATIQGMPDGGCTLMTVCGRMTSIDGGSMIASCEGINAQLRAGGGQGVCLALLDTSTRLWLLRQGISSADSGVADAGL